MEYKASKKLRDFLYSYSREVGFDFYECRPDKLAFFDYKSYKVHMIEEHGHSDW